MMIFWNCYFVLSLIWKKMKKRRRKMMNLRRMMILGRINIVACGDGVLAKLVKSQSSTPSF